MLIKDIAVGDRARKDLGDLKSLAASIERHGLLHPVVVKKDNTLVAGYRRIEAARLLRWKDIPASIIDVDDLLSAERDENTERKDFTPSEAVSIGALVEAAHREKIAQQQHALSVRAGKLRHGITPTLNQSPAGNTAKAAAKAVGIGVTKYRQARAVISAAEADPKKFGDLATKMDETGSVNAAHQELMERQGKPKWANRSRLSTRNPIQRRMRYLQPNREIEKAVFALTGICEVLETLDIKALDKAHTGKWGKSLKKSASIIHRIARGLNG